MECRILQENGKALDLRLRCAPITIDGEIFSIFVAHNIENEKRREALERIFFHDIINTASGLKGLINFMEENSNKEEFKTYKNMMEISIDTLIEEISAQQDLLAAENKKLKLHLERFDSFSIMEEVTAIYKRHEAGMGKKLKISNNSCREKISSDKRLLKRTISNMTKNALEASKLDETVTLGCMSWEDSIEFWTHNKRCIPREVQLQIFQRSFSTKGRGRGIGTWSIKLLTEQYLQGSVSFESSEESGTVFKVIIPFEDSRKSEE
jgi:signal transduction histidine kinase